VFFVDKNGYSGYNVRAMARARVTINTKAVREALSERGLSQRKTAQLMESSPNTMSNVLAGRVSPGNRFTASLLHTLGEKGREVHFEELFDVVVDPAARRPQAEQRVSGGV
jgi:transcriptional regulator with XRE-family HTH domain